MFGEIFMTEVKSKIVNSVLKRKDRKVIFGV